MPSALPKFVLICFVFLFVSLVKSVSKSVPPITVPLISSNEEKKQGEKFYLINIKMKYNLLFNYYFPYRRKTN